MEDTIDDLILERAPWLAQKTRLVRASRMLLNQILCYQRTKTLADAFGPLSADNIMHFMGHLLSQKVTATGLHHIPTVGPALIVANHPTGIADGVILNHILRQRRKDLYTFANRDIMRILPQMSDVICPVEWRIDKRSHTSARETMTYVRDAKDAGRMGLIFPSGRLAKRRGFTLHERPWMSSAAMLARKFDLPVIPINIKARNSALFYFFDAVHPTLRDITLFYETLNKDRQPFDVTIGTPIEGSSLPRNADEGIAILRRATLALGESNDIDRPRGPYAKGLLGQS